MPTLNIRNKFVANGAHPTAGTISFSGPDAEGWDAGNETFTYGENDANSSDTTGTYTFTLTIPANGSCAQQSADCIVTLGSAFEAGNAAPVSVCNNQQALVSLADIFSGEDAGGTFSLNPGSETPDSGALNLAAGTFDPDDHTPKTITIDYTGGSGACEDSQTSTITVDEFFDAGTGGNEFYCI